MSSNTDTAQLFTDHTVTDVNGSTFVKVGSAREWAAYVKAGYVVHSTLRPFKGNQASYGLTDAAPEMVRYVAMLRDEELVDGTTTDEYIEYVDRHADFFQRRRNARH